MAPRSKKAAAKAAEVEEEERDYTTYVDKDPTEKQERFTDWILRVTGYEPADEEDFRMGAKLGQILYMYYQKSSENQAILAERRAAAAEDKATPKPKARRGRPSKVEDADDVDEDVEEDTEEEEEVKPTRRKASARKPSTATRKTPAKATAGKPRTRRAAKPRGESSAAPF